MSILSEKMFPFKGGGFGGIFNFFRLFRNVLTDPGSDLTTECTEETQKHTEKKKKKNVS